MAALLKNYLDFPCGARYMFDRVETASSVSHRFLAEMPMMTSREEISRYYGKLKKMHSFLLEDKGSAESIRMKIHRLSDVKGTLRRLHSCEVLDDIELYEIKLLSLIISDVSRICGSCGLDFISLPDVEKAVEILDPEGHRVPSFYICNSYSPKLKSLRERMEQASSETEYNELFSKAVTEENIVRNMLCGKLWPFADRLSEGFAAIMETDILLAKAMQIEEMGLCFPEVSDNGETAYESMFHPLVRENMKAEGIRFQEIDIRFGRECTSVIGANMGGKTMILRMLALSQLLFQFGFGIPARSAVADIKEDVVFVVGDNQDEYKGISSFSAEISALDTIIRLSDAGKCVLALVDEPARTTNPIEGAALVEGLLLRLEKSCISLVMTTHYNIESGKCRKYKVKGLTDKGMDYSLTEAADGAVPHEALNIAESLNADRLWLEYAGELVRRRHDTAGIRQPFRNAGPAAN